MSPLVATLIESLVDPFQITKYGKHRHWKLDHHPHCEGDDCRAGVAFQLYSLQSWGWASAALPPGFKNQILSFDNKIYFECLQSCILAEYLLTVQFMNLNSIADALDLHPHDIPLLLVSLLPNNTLISIKVIFKIKNAIFDVLTFSHAGKKSMEKHLLFHQWFLLSHTLLHFYDDLNLFRQLLLLTPRWLGKSLGSDSQRIFPSEQKCDNNNEHCQRQNGPRVLILWVISPAKKNASCIGQLYVAPLV